jgi:hypothetical protein
MQPPGLLRPHRQKETPKPTKVLHRIDSSLISLTQSRSKSGTKIFKAILWLDLVSRTEETGIIRMIQVAGMTSNSKCERYDMNTHTAKQCRFDDADLSAIKQAVAHQIKHYRQQLATRKKFREEKEKKAAKRTTAASRTTDATAKS